MKLTPKQDMIVSLLQDGYQMIIGLSETSGRPYYLIASTHNNGYGSTYFNATVFSNLLSKELIHQSASSHNWELTPLGENYKCKYKHNKK